MSLLFRIVYAAHANGTHHKLALDALSQMERPDADAWRRLFLKHVALFLEGSKAPDVSFKDFKNHVLHVGDNYWGGAPEKVEAWYGHTVEALRAGKWADAVYAAGVLSHYYTDPVHPFHTAQTEAENAIHRAVEWSINRSYDRLRKEAVARHGDLEVPVRVGEHWLRETVCDGAEFSNRHYEKLIAHYNFKAGVVRPEEGFDEVGNAAVAELLMYASEGYCNLLERAINEAGVEAPPVNLTLNTIVATLKIPRKWIEKRLANAEDRAIVQAMYDELQATGRVEHSLPEDDRVIRDLHAREVLSPRLAARNAARGARVPDGDPADRFAAQRRSALAGRAAPPPAPAAGKSSSTSAPTPPVVRASVGLPRDVRDAAFAPTAATTGANAGANDVPITDVAAATIGTAKPQITSTETKAPRQPSATPASDEPTLRRYLTLTDDLEAAPSIGPKLAARFAELGVKTVSDFLGHDPYDLAELLDDSRIDGDTLTDWQDQAQLVIDVPGLRGTHAQLLVGAGYRTRAAVADSEAASLAADVLAYATSADGKRTLRDGNPPDLEKIKGWLDAAQQAEAA